MRRVLSLLLFLPLGLTAQINTDRTMLIGRNALYYDDYVLSIQYFNQVVNAKPYLSEPYFYRGVAKFYLDDYVGAADDCSRSIERNSFIPDAFRLRGLCHIKLGQMADAVADYNRSLALDPEDKSAWYNRVLCRLELRQYDTARLELDSMIFRWRDYIQAYELKTQVLFLQKDTLQADTVMTQALLIKPDDAPLLGMKAQLSLWREQYALADSMFTRAIAARPDEADYYLGRALAGYQLRKLRQSMSDYDRALELEPDNFYGHYNRGLLRAQVGEDNKALDDFDFVLRREPRNTLALYNRVVLREKTGNLRGAIADLTRIINLHPRFWAGYQKRAELRRRVGDVRGATSDERRLVVAGLDQMFGSRPRPSRRGGVRKRKEDNIDDYQKFVINDDIADTASIGDYKSELRGRIQNRHVAEKPLEAYAFHLADGHGSQQEAQHSGYLPLLTRWNRSLPASDRRAVLSNQSTALGTAAYNDLLTRLSRLKPADTLQAARAMYSSLMFSTVRNYEAALSAATRAAADTSLLPLALWQRACVRLSLAELGRSGAQQPLSPRQATATQVGSELALRPALDDFVHALNLLPDNVFLLYNIACVYQLMGRTDDALAYYNRAILGDPRFADAYFNRGLLQLKCGRRDEGLRDLSRAGELGIPQAYSLIRQHRK